MNNSYESGQQRRKWYIGREIPIATIIVLLMQTVGVVWWAASTSVKVDFLKESNLAQQIVQTSIDKRQDDDSQRSESRVLAQLTKLEMKIDELIKERRK